MSELVNDSFFWAIRSFALLLIKNEQFAQFFCLKSYFLVHFLYVFCKFKKTRDSLIPSFLMSDVSKSLSSLTKNERCEQIAQVAHQKWANEWITRFLSELLIR